MAYLVVIQCFRQTVAHYPVCSSYSSVQLDVKHPSFDHILSIMVSIITIQSFAALVAIATIAAEVIDRCSGTDLASYYNSFVKYDREN